MVELKPLNKRRKSAKLTTKLILLVFLLAFAVPLAYFYVEKEVPKVLVETPSDSFISRSGILEISYMVSEDSPPNFFPLNYLIPVLEGGEHSLKECSVLMNGLVVYHQNLPKESDRIDISLSNLSEGEKEWEISCKDTSFFKNEGFSGKNRLLVIIPRPPKVNILNLDSRKILILKNTTFRFTVSEDIGKNINQSALEDYSSFDVLPVSNCSVAVDGSMFDVLFEVAPDRTHSVDYSNLTTGSHLLEVYCTGVSENYVGGDSANFLAIIPFSAGEMSFAKSSLSVPYRLYFLEDPLETKSFYKTIGYLDMDNTFEPSLNLTEDEAGMRILKISLDPEGRGNLVKEQNVSVNTSRGPLNIYLPGFYNDGYTDVGFYVSDDGSTFWHTKLKGTAIAPPAEMELGGFEALNPKYLARASPGFNFSENLKYYADIEEARRVMENLSRKVACPSVPCEYIGNALINNLGEWDWPGKYVSATYPYELVLDEDYELDMKLRFDLSHTYTLTPQTGLIETPNTMKIFIDGVEVYNFTQGPGDPTNVIATVAFHLGPLKKGTHFISMDATNPGYFEFSGFEIERKGAFGYPSFVVEKESSNAETVLKNNGFWEKIMGAQGID